ncbi:MAG: YicC/YloC family endoribonuclease, partial [Clostridia bacterium]
MTRSMTGYGRAQASCDGNEVVVEIRSVNHRYFDCNIRTPRGYTFLEEPLKARLQKSISRGKIDLFVTIDSSNAENVAISLNEPAARAYIDIASALHDKFGIEDDMSATQLMKMQDVLSVTRKEADEEKLAASVMSALEEALR